MICTRNLARIRLHSSFKKRKIRHLRDMGPRKKYISESLANSSIRPTRDPRLCKTSTHTNRCLVLAMTRCGPPLSTTQAKKLPGYSIRGLSRSQQELWQQTHFSRKRQQRTTPIENWSPQKISTNILSKRLKTMRADLSLRARTSITWEQQMK